MFSECYFGNLAEQIKNVHSRNAIYSIMTHLSANENITLSYHTLTEMFDDRLQFSNN